MQCIKNISQNKQEIIDFLFHDKLKEHCLQDDDNPETYFDDYNNSEYLGIYAERKLICIVRIEMLSPVMFQFHLYLHPDLWGQGYCGECYRTFEQYIKKHYPAVLKLVITTPACCKQVIHRADRNGFNPEGYISVGTVWRGKVEDFAILTKQIRRL